MKRYLSAQEASEILQINITSLYAYVSRGLIRSEQGEGKSRAKRYHSEDVYKLAERKEARKNPEKLVENALHWGTPILESSITLIKNNQLFYRGISINELVDNWTFEEVASLIWQPNLNHRQNLFTAQRKEDNQSMINRVEKQLDYIEGLQAMLAVISASDYSAYDTKRDKVINTGSKILGLMVQYVADQVNHDSSSLANHLANTVGDGSEICEKLLNSALIACADHELNISTFTARCIASAQSNPYASVIGGLSALRGTKHGGHTERVEALFTEIDYSGSIEAVVSGRLKRGEIIPGFGHHLYPEGDPRAHILLNQLEKLLPENHAVMLSRRISEVVENLTTRKPTIDFALVTLCRSLSLPKGFPLALFAIGRTAGWIGHILEQYETNQLIRPRAKYTGPQPVNS